MQINFRGGGQSEDDIRMAKEQWDAFKNQFKQMKPKDVVILILAIGVAFTLIGVAIYGGTVENYILVGIGAGGFVGFILILAIIEVIRRKVSINAIKNSPMAQETEGTVISYAMYSSANVNGRITSLTLKVNMNLGGAESTGYYKLNSNEIQSLREIYTNGLLTQSVKDALPIKEGDKFLVKYLPSKPKNCIILEKLASIDSHDYNNQFRITGE